ncbi:MAG TPA: UdgX family uracil-DNA binding protein [Rhizomicrobium sp.]|jgi:DNA polymerase|nr:UdgX family uracil-DNA binding protein [Rhizomicrobium sp.]
MSLFEQQLREETPRSLKALREAENACRRCDLYKFATQAVPGEGPAHAPLMLLGEQPGNDEDLDGHPFVGPAGRVLDKALQEAGIHRKQVFVTNAVKHFKHEMRGKRRLHKRPDPGEIEACRWWQQIERELVKPKLMVALGATAARSVFERVITINKVRGRVQPVPDGGKALVTIHPSYLLRLHEARDKEREYARFVADLETARDFLRAA